MELAIGHNPNADNYGKTLTPRYHFALVWVILNFLTVLVSSSALVGSEGSQVASYIFQRNDACTHLCMYIPPGAADYPLVRTFRI